MKSTPRPQPYTPIEKLILPFERFLQRESSSGILLIITTILALIWANSPWQHGYHEIWETTVTIGFGEFVLSKSLHHWINDGLMSIFFFVVGLEIKREFLVGELSTFRQALLPIAAAIGGMVFPALGYVIFNHDVPENMNGWGIPMATDIAFALGVLTLLGKRVPFSLKIFLTALAIVDDIGAVLVIAIFYTSKLSIISLVIGFISFGFMIFANRLGVKKPVVYALFGLVLWVAFLKSGVHATVAGVLGAFAIPVRTRINTETFMNQVQEFLKQFSMAGDKGPDIILNDSQRGSIEEIETYCEYVESPLQRLEHTLHPWVAFLIIPIFALANAGVTISGDFFAALQHPIALGIMAGLFFGKQVGIMFLTWLSIKLKICVKPEGAKWMHIYGVCCLAGMGFTMSLFIANLAFPTHPEYLDLSKIGILVASLAAGILGTIVLMACPKSK